MIHVLTWFTVYRCSCREGFMDDQPCSLHEWHPTARGKTWMAVGQYSALGEHPIHDQTTLCLGCSLFWMLGNDPYCTHVCGSWQRAKNELNSQADRMVTTTYAWQSCTSDQKDRKETSLLILVDFRCQHVLFIKPSWSPLIKPYSHYTTIDQAYQNNFSNRLLQR